VKILDTPPVREKDPEVSSAPLSHDSTEYYTPQYILDAVIASMGAIDPGLCT